MKTDSRVDDYIARASPFAQPILMRIRAAAHAALPQGEEGIKWGMPHFMVGGKNVGGMSAFKAHCAFVVHGDGRQGGADGMGAYGKIATLDDLPTDAEMVERLREAAQRVAEQGSATAGRKRTPKPELPVPDDLAARLAGNPGARAAFDGFAPSHRREYIEWITEAKREETRAKRLEQTIEWLLQGKKRNWKYEN